MKCEEQDLQKKLLERNKAHQDYLVYQIQQRSTKQEQEKMELFNSMQQIQQSQRNHKEQVLEYIKSQQY